ncbi:MAG: maleylpyruvate isomerase family mycothiol-dependent enzyme [Ilumatobacter sp.]
MNLDSYLGAIRDDAQRTAACAERSDLSTPITGCPGWDLRTLVVHLGWVHRWATQAIQQCSAPAAAEISTPNADATGAELAAWLRLGSGILADVLATTRLDAATWHPFPLEQRAWVWSRRQTHETAMHRWDAEFATLGASTLDAEVAADGLHEFFEMLLPRSLQRSDSSIPDSSLHIHCTDDGLAQGAGEWIIWGEHGEYRMEAVHRKGDAAVRGHAGDVLVAVMGRMGRDRLDVVGDPAVLDAWLPNQAP